MKTFMTLSWAAAVFAGYLLASVGGASVAAAMPCTPGGDLDSFWPPCPEKKAEESSSGSSAQPATQPPVKVFISPSHRMQQAPQTGHLVLTPILRVQPAVPMPQGARVERKRVGGIGAALTPSR